MEVAADKKSGCAVVQEQTLPSRLHTKIPENYTGLPNKGQCSKEGFTSNMETCKKEMDLLLCEAVDTLLKKRPSVLSQHCQNMTRIRPHNFWTTLSMLADRSCSLQVSNAQLVAPVSHNQCYFVTLTEQLQALILLLDLLARDSKMLDVHKTSIHQYYLTSFIKLLAHVFRKYTHLLRTANLKELLDCFLPVAERSIEEMGSLGFDISPFSESYKEDTSLVPTLCSHIASLQQHEKANALKTKIAPKCDQQPLKTGCVVSHVKPRINASGRIVKTGIVSKSSQRKRESTSRPELFSWSLCALAPKLPRPEVLINSNDDHCTSNNADVGDKCLISNNTNNNAEQGSVAKTTQASQSLQHGPTSAHTVLKCQHLPEIKDSTIAATKMFLGFKRPLVVHDPNTRAKVEPRQQKQLKQLTLSNWKLS